MELHRTKQTLRQLSNVQNSKQTGNRGGRKMRVYKTTDYSQFRTVSGNRDIDSANFKNLLKAVSEKNLLDINPIVVNKNMEVIDGQHRLAVAKALRVPVYYYIAGRVNHSDIIVLNNVSKRWNMFNFANYWAKRGYKSYAFIVEMHKKHSIPVSNLLGVINDMAVGTNKKSYIKVKQFKDGQMELNDIQKMLLTRFCDKLETLQKYFPFAKQRNFVGAFFMISRSEKFDFRKLVKRLDAGAKIEKQPDVTDYKRELENAYNYNIHVKNRVRLF